MSEIPIEPHREFLEHLDDETCYSVARLRQRGRSCGYWGESLTQLTQALIWQRHYHEFPKKGDGVDSFGDRDQPGWSGCRWKALLIKEQPRQSWLRRWFKPAA